MFEPVKETQVNTYAFTHHVTYCTCPHNSTKHAYTHIHFQEIAFLQSLLETLLYSLSPSKYNMPQLLFGMVCDCKHVPKSVRLAQEMKGQRIPISTLRDTMEGLRASGVHEKRLLCLLLSHGQKGERLVFWRADNYQRLYNAVASAAAVDASKDSAHIGSVHICNKVRYVCVSVCM